MIPDTFKLFSNTWQIRTATAKELETDLGRCYPDELEIILNPNQSAEGIKQTLMHELVHSIELKLNLELTERQVDVLALGLRHLFKENPGLLEILQAD
jgi:hypothetical protein